jgi:hypothetical protein
MIGGHHGGGEITRLIFAVNNFAQFFGVARQAQLMINSFGESSQPT